MPKINLEKDFLEHDGDSLKDANSYDVIDSNNEHDSLIKSLTKKYSSQKDQSWKSTRSEAQNCISQHGMSKPSKKEVHINQLLKIVGNDGNSKKTLKKIEQKKAISKPLLKPLADKVARQVNFKELKQEISKYDKIVKDVRNSAQIVFPAEDEKVTFRESNNVETNDMFLTENESKLLKTMSLEEAINLHKQNKRRRVLISYHEAKFQRFRKIKSKKYHRLLKKNKLKKTVEEFDELVATNSEKAVEKLEELDRLRALERASLKHLNTGKWAKHNKIRSKYNEQSRNELNEQLKINQAMMKKHAMSLPVADDILDDDDSNVNQSTNYQFETKSDQEFVEQAMNYNPWITSKKLPLKTFILQQKHSESDDFKNEYFEKSIIKRVRQRVKNAKMDGINQRLNDDKNEENIIDEGIESKRPQMVEDDHIDLNESDSSDDEHQNYSDQIQNLDSKNFIQNIQDVKKRLETINFDDDNDEINDFGGDDLNFNNSQSSKYLREAFADDDVIVDFMEEKKQKEQNKTETEKSSYLPGWDSWSGSGIKKNRKEINKEKQRLQQKQKRIENKICNAILGYPYKAKQSSIGDTTILKPIGSIWCPQTISKTLKAPKIITRSGLIIQPMKPIQQ